MSSLKGLFKKIQEFESPFLEDRFLSTLPFQCVNLETLNTSLGTDFFRPMSHATLSQYPLDLEEEYTQEHYQLQRLLWAKPHDPWIWTPMEYARHMSTRMRDDFYYFYRQHICGGIRTLRTLTKWEGV
jgi:hypothetical protein